MFEVSKFCRFELTMWPWLLDALIGPLTEIGGGVLADEVFIDEESETELDAGDGDSFRFGLFLFEVAAESTWSACVCSNELSAWVCNTKSSCSCSFCSFFSICCKRFRC